jgi:hypothetical protein
MGFRERYGPWAIVTGASSGIGEETAKQLAARGLSLLLVARRRDRLEQLSADLTAAHGIEARVVELDLSREDSVDRLADAAAGLEVGLLVNNAGFGMKGKFLELDLAEQRRMVALNCRAPLDLTHAFGRAMVARKRGGVIVVSSTGAFQGLPESGVYGATKGFDLLFGEALRDELRGTGVDVLVLCPGPTDTEGPKRTGVNPENVPGMMHVAPVVKAALDGLGRRGVVIPGLLNRVAYFLVCLLPRAFATRMAGRMIRRATGG